MAEQEASARGVIRREEMPFLSEYGTAYLHSDEEEDGYKYAIKSDEYRFGEYVGLRAEVSGPVSDVGKGLAVLNVTRIRLLPVR
jgi:endo-1,4-beta-D-glucanase Y